VTYMEYTVGMATPTMVAATTAMLVMAISITATGASLPIAIGRTLSPPAD